MRLRWEAVAFAELGVERLYALLALRQRVFVIEQHCVYLDADGVDPACLHLLGWHEADDAATLRACLRLVPPGLKYAEASIGRIVTDSVLRGTGQGRQLVRRGIELAERVHPGAGLRISAQAHLARFYADFGFAGVGEPYPEDGIPHLEMLRPAALSSPADSSFVLR